MKQLSLKGIKKKAWDSFSRYIRLRDCIRATGTAEVGICITCGKAYSFKQLQAGHFIAGRCLAVLFDEECVHAQCYACNCMLHGNVLAYRKKINELYGDGHDEVLMTRSKSIMKYYFNDYFLLLKLYEKKYEKLMEELCKK